MRWPLRRDAVVSVQRYATRFYLSSWFWGSFAVRSMKFRTANNLEVGAGYRVGLR